MRVVKELELQCKLHNLFIVSTVPFFCLDSEQCTECECVCVCERERERGRGRWERGTRLMSGQTVYVRVVRFT